jgi:hypothetical protein
LLLAQAEEGVEETQTQGGPDLLFSSNITRQQLLEKEEQFKVREPALQCGNRDVVTYAADMHMSPSSPQAKVAANIWHRRCVVC